MMDDKYYDDRSEEFAEDNSDALIAGTAAGAGLASLFLHSDKKKKLNEKILFGKKFFKNYNDLAEDNKDNITKNILQAYENTKKDFLDTKDIGYSFRAGDLKNIQYINEYYKTLLFENGYKKAQYLSELRGYALNNVLSKYAGRVNEAVYSNVVYELEDIARIYDKSANFRKNMRGTLDKTAVTAKLSKRLSEENFQVASEIVNEIFESFNETDLSSYEIWENNRGSAFIGGLRERLLDFKYFNKSQDNEINKILESLDPYSKEVTIGDILSIDSDLTNKNRNKIKELFKNDYLIVEKEELLDKLFTDLQNPEYVSAKKEFGTGGTGRAKINILELLRHQRSILSGDDLEAFNSLRIDGLRLTKNGNLFSLADVDEMVKNGFKDATSLFPINLIHLKSLVSQRERETVYHHISAGINDPLLALRMGKDGTLTDSSVVRVGDRVFKVKTDNTFEEIEELRGSLYADDSSGPVRSTGREMANAAASQNYQKLEDEISGSDKTKFEKITNWIGFETPEIKKRNIEAGSNSYKYINISQETIDKFQEISDTLKKKDRDLTQDEFKHIESIERFRQFSDSNVKGLSPEDARNILEKVSDLNEQEKRYLNLISKLSDPNNLDEVITELSGLGINNLSFDNPQLNYTVRGYLKDPKKARSSFRVKKDPFRTKSGSYESMSFVENLIEDISKAFYNSREKHVGFNELLGDLNKALDSESLDGAKNAAAVNSFFKRLNLPVEKNVTFADRVDDIIKGLKSIAEKVDAEDTDTNAMMDQMKFFVSSEEYYSDMVKAVQKDAVRYPTAGGLHFNKTISPLGIIKAVNTGYFNPKSGIKFVKQFFAGMDDPNYITAAGLPGSHLMKRLMDLGNESFSEFGLDFGEITGYELNPNMFNRKDMSSIGSMAKGILLKRALPLAGLYMAYNLLDDAFEATTGMGTTESVASGAANVYLGIKKITGTVGLDSTLKSLSRDNALINYIAGRGDQGGEWENYEEKLDYYKNGYDPIRKSRFWWFASSNEIRGGKISYWEPNTLRTISSDYYDKSLYNGSYLAKWNPFRILNPYYLEDMHSEDRPYPISGSLFDDATPWGVFLNTTIGEIYKPKRLLHQDRLDESGVDVKALIYQMNEKIREAEHNKIITVKGGKLQSATFNAYNAPTYSERILTTNTSGDIWYNDYQTPNIDGQDMDVDAYEKYVDTEKELIGNIRNSQISLKERISIEAAKGNNIAQIINLGKSSSLNIIRQNNYSIRAKNAKTSEDLKAQGIFVEDKLSMQYSAIDELIDNSELIENLMNEGSANDYVQQAAISMRMLTGLYGYGLKTSIDFGDNNYDRIATSQDMTSNSRAFWDENMGGIGGSQMELIRRFIPEYRRFQTYNPLMNTMPDWLPEQYRFGDPYAKLPNGEARLPGLGYESLNRLHPDIYGDYGAFDRFKILADIAPWSPEYKVWRSIASKTVLDPELKKEMKDIRNRVKEQSKRHDFMPYKYVGRGLERTETRVTEVLKNGQFKVFGSNEVYKLAGVRVKANEYETTEDVLKRYLKEGQTIILTTDENELYGRNRDRANSINAGVIIDGQSIGQLMLQNNDAEKRKSDMSSAAYMTDHGPMVNDFNWITEAVMHANIPILHNRFMRANDALEDYKDEYVYGTSFQNLNNIMQTMIIPNMNIATSSPFWTTLGIATDVINNNLQKSSECKNNVLSQFIRDNFKLEDTKNNASRPKVDGIKNSTIKKWAHRAHIYTDRGALMGNIIGKTIKFGSPGRDRFAKTYAKPIGSALTLAYSAYNNPDDLIVQTASLSRLGWLAGERILKAHRSKLALIGAGIGFTRWLMETPSDYVQEIKNSETGYNVFIPDEVRKRWEINEYFDRLTYIKYMGLFEEAAEKALDEEDVDIKKIIKLQELESKEIKESKKYLKEELKKLDEKTDKENEDFKEKIRFKIKSLKPTETVLTGGEYTQAALLYYGAAKSTMFALNENSSMTEIVRALPETDRSYFMEFIKERDPEKRNEIMKYASPQLRKALNMLWYGEYSEPESMESYFSEHVLPAPTWGGWSQQVSLDDVKAKVVKNEAMDISGFGIYASEYDDPKVIYAPSLDYSEDSDGYIVNALKLRTILNGMGLSDVDVKIHPHEASSIEVIANIGRVAVYNINESIDNFFEVNI